MKSSENTEDIAERLFNFIHLAYINDTRRVGRFFEEAKKRAEQANQFYVFADSLLNQSDTDLSANTLDVAFKNYQTTMDSMSMCIARYSVSQTHEDSLIQTLKGQSTGHLRLTVTILKSSVARMEFRVMSLLFRNIDHNSDWIPQISLSGAVCGASRTRIDLMSRGFQEYSNRFVTLDSVLFNGRLIGSTAATADVSRSFARIEIENSESGMYRLIGRIEIIRDDGVSAVIPFDEEVEVDVSDK